MLPADPSGLRHLLLRSFRLCSRRCALSRMSVWRQSAPGGAPQQRRLCAEKGFISHTFLVTPRCRCLLATLWRNGEVLTVSAS
jgi:hypothetical protein